MRTNSSAANSHSLVAWFFRTTLSLIASGTVLQASAVVYAQDEEDAIPLGQRPTVRVGVLPPELRLDGHMSERAWTDAADSIPSLTMIEPEEGGVPEGRTTVKVLANESAIAIGVQCDDPEPKRLVAFSKARDSALEEEDHVVIVLDTFLDGRSGYVFVVNPAGARFDGLVAARGEEANGDWDTVWEAATTRNERGWSAEIRIPASSLPFKKGLTSWGFNIQRRVQRLQETSRWSGPNLDYEIYQTSRAGLLTDLPAFDLGVGLTVRPSALGITRKPAPFKDTKSDGELSLDVTQRLGPNLQSSLTVNTDFSETEVDVRRINLTRFPVLFPEKRTFFLAGADIFEFGVGLDEETLIPFFTRRIGLVGADEDEQTPIPINAGGKISGRIGGSSIGALAVNTRKTNRVSIDEGIFADVPDATMGAVRIKQDLLEESAFGVLATFGDQMDRAGSWSGGADLTLQTSGFQEDKNLLLGIWGLHADRNGLAGDKDAYGARFEYPNDLWDVSLGATRIGNAFDPSLGFVSRRGVDIYAAGVEFAPRPSWPLVRQLFHEVAYTHFENRRTTRWESYTLGVKPLDWLFASGDRLEYNVEWEGDRPASEFEVYPDIDVAPGSYEWSRNNFALRTAEKRIVSGELRYERGGFYTGSLRTVGLRLTLKPSSLFTFELTGERSRTQLWSPENESIQLYDKRFTEDLFGGRFELNVSPNLQLSSLTQYDSESRELGSNTRLRWTFDPRGDLFLVYNHNALRTLNKEWRFGSYQVPMKLQFAWQF